MRPNTGFIKSIEDMKSSDLHTSGYLSEDRESRQKRREERRQERQERKFDDSSKGGAYDSVSSDSGKFKLPAFIKALEGIKNQIIAQLVDTDTALKSEELGGKKAAKKFKAKFLDLLDRAAKIIAEANYRREKEGKKLEDDDPNDKILIKGYRENYNSLKNDFEKSLNDYTEEINTEKTEYLKDLKYKEIVNPVEEARNLFATALEKFAGILKNVKPISSASTSPTGATGEQKKDDKPATSDIKIESPIKKGTGSRSKPDEKVKKIQELILNKFKNKDVVTKTQEWKLFSKYGADGAFGNATGNLIIRLKSGFGLDDKTSDMTQAFVDELSALKEAKVFLKYEDFLKMNEAWSDEAFSKSIGSSKTTETPVKKKETKKEEKKEEEKKEGEKKEVEKKEEEKKETDGGAKEIEGLLIKASESLKNLFSDKSFWEDFKGINDDEDGASEEFKNWFSTTFTSKYLKPITSKIEKITNEEDKNILSNNLKTLTDSSSKIVKKIKGAETDDNFYWKIYLLDGGVKSFKIDTDF